VEIKEALRVGGDRSKGTLLSKDQKLSAGWSESCSASFSATGGCPADFGVPILNGLPFSLTPSVQLYSSLSLTLLQSGGVLSVLISFGCARRTSGACGCICEGLEDVLEIVVTVVAFNEEAALWRWMRRVYIGV
jgi:hypothetical protein